MSIVRVLPCIGNNFFYLLQSNHENLDPREPTVRLAYIFYDATNQRINITERELFEPGDRTALVSELFTFEGESVIRFC